MPSYEQVCVLGFPDGSTVSGPLTISTRMPWRHLKLSRFHVELIIYSSVVQARSPQVTLNSPLLKSVLCPLPHMDLCPILLILPSRDLFYFHRLCLLPLSEFRFLRFSVFSLLSPNQPILQMATTKNYHSITPEHKTLWEFNFRVYLVLFIRRIIKRKEP